VRVSQAGDRRRPLVLKFFFVAQRCDSGFVQSGFCEVALIIVLQALLWLGDLTEPSRFKNPFVQIRHVGDFFNSIDPQETCEALDCCCANER
jgi:hypothetical protein